MILNPIDYLNCIIPKLQGRLGNMMFQIAHSYAKSIEYNRHLLIPSKDSCSEQYENTIFRKLDFNLKKSDDVFDGKYINGTFHYSHSSPYKNYNTIYRGFYQSEKYFKKYSEVIRDLFYPPKDFITQAISDFPFLQNSKVSAINVRRGDYLSQPTRHPTVDISYINKAYEKLPKHSNLIIMSDDTDWCKKNIRLPNSIFIEQNEYRREKGIWLLSLCDYFIISNSSFSWWGAWLSKSIDKIVVAPSTWFGPDINEIIEDIYCENWIRIPTMYEDGRVICSL
jgi:hypothetical protein